MAIEKRELEIAKECDDVMRLFVDLVIDVKAGKNAGVIAAENLPGLMEAITGADQISGEAAENRKVVMATVGYRAGELTDAIMG